MTRFLFSVIAIVAFPAFVFAQAPLLGIYPSASVTAGANTTISPAAGPSFTTSMVAYTNTNFSGVFSVDPISGVVRVTDAKPAGVYVVTVKAFGPGGTMTRNLTLTVTNPNCSQGTFLSPVNYGVGSSPNCVVVGDVNNDGNQDFLTADFNSNRISVRLGNGDGTFFSAPNVTVGVNPIFLAIGDFNEDGKPDFVSANYGSNNLSIKLGDGAGNFSGVTLISLGDTPRSVAVGDFNNDGHQDITASQYSLNSASVHLGDGLSNFAALPLVAVAPGPWQVVVGDFNNDGNQDLASSNMGSGTVSIRIGDGLGGFSGTTNVSLGGTLLSMCIGDFNNDGNQDFAAGEYGGNQVYVRLGNGAGGFSGSTAVIAGTTVYNVAVGDFNGDGNQDITTANMSSSDLSIRYGNGAGTFSGTYNITIGNSPFSVAVGDFNEDNVLDLAGATNGINAISICLGLCKEIQVTGNATNIADGDITPSGLDHTNFGSLLVCVGTVVRTFTIQNTGTVALTLGAITITGPQAGDFTVISTPSGSVAPAASTTFQVSWDPSFIGFGTATISVANDDCDENPYDFAVTGNGFADVVNPSITCPAHITTTANFGLCSAVVNYTTPSVVDNCGTPTLVQTAGLPSGSAFPVGVTVNTFVVTDGSGNSANCSFSVTVTDAQAPVLYTMSCTNSNAAGTAYNDGWQNGDNDGTGFGAWTLNASTGNTGQAGFVIGSSTTNGAGVDSNGDQDINTSGRALGMYANSAQATQAVRPLSAPLAVGSTIKIEFDNGFVDPGQIVGFQMQNASGLSLGEVRFRGGQSSYEKVDVMGITPFSTIAFTDEGLIIEVTSLSTGQAQVKLTRKVSGTTETLISTLFPGGGNQVIQKIMIFNSNAGTGVTKYLYVNNFQVCAPSLGCPANVSVSNNTGVCGATVVYNPVLASDNCSPSLAVTQTAGLPSGSLFPVGTTTNTFSATDGSGNTVTCSFTVTVADTTDPVAICNSFSLMLGNISGAATITAPMINNGSTDNCGIASMSVSPNSFTCANIGPNNVTLTVTDASGNSSVCAGVITVLDTARPNLTSCPGAQTVVVGAGCTALVPDYTGLVTATDNCGVASITQISPLPGSTISLGATVSVTVQVTDPSGNSRNCVFSLTAVGPEMNVTGNSITIPDGDVTPSTTDLTDFGSALICGGQVTHTFVIQNTGNDTLDITGFNSTDMSYMVTAYSSPILPGNSGTISIMFQPVTAGLHASTISIQNTDCDEAPYNFALTGYGYESDIDVLGNSVLIANNDTTPALADHTDFGSQTVCLGTVSRTFTIDNNSTPGYGVFGISVNISGANSSDFTVTANPATGIPWALQTTTFTVMFDPSAPGLRTATINVTSNDCDENPYTFAISGFGDDPEVNVIGNGQSIADGDMTPTTVDHTDFGSVLTCNGNIIRTFTVENTGNSTLALGAITVAGANPSDFSLFATTLSSTLAPGGSGIIQIRFDPTATGLRTATISFGNDDCDESPYNFAVQGTGNADIVNPVASCQNISLYLNSSGTASVIPAMINNGSTDNCGIASMSVSPNSFTCANVGPNNVTLTVTDASGNSSVCTGVVTVLDSTRPVANCQNISVHLNAAGTANITGAMVNNGSTDACGIASLAVSPSSFTCANVGPNTVTLTVTDVNGRTSTCNSVVTVVDTIRPVVNCQNINAYLDASGFVSAMLPLLTSQTASDNCNSVSISFSPVTFTCSNIGPNSVTVTGTDDSGNSSSCISTVTVIDTIRPVAVCQNATITLVGGTATVAANAINNGSTDACGVASVSVFPNTFDCTDLGANTVTLTVTDNNGNTSTCTSTVTVLSDFTSSIAVNNNVSCNGGTNGQATITHSGGAGPFTYLWLPSGGTGATSTGLSAGNYTCTVTDAGGCVTSQTVNITAPSALVATAASQTNISCNGGSNGAASVTVSGGTAAYSYNWTPGNPTGDGTASVTGLTAGTWTCTVADANSCVTTQTFNITAPSALVAASSAGSILCNGGTTTVTVVGSGGTSPYTGTGTFTVTAGTYSYIVTDANGCTNSTSITVTQPTALAGAATATPILCNGGNATVTVVGSGGTSPYSGTGTFTVTAGTYSYTVTDANGCTNTTSITVTQPTALASAATATPILCNGGNATVTVVGTGGTSPYTGTGTFTVTAGTYSYTVTDANGCTNTTSITVTQPTALAGAATATPILCNGGNATVTVTGSGGTSPYTGTGTFTVTAGTYSYTVTDANGCTNTTSITVTEPTALTATSSATSILCNGGNATVTVVGAGGTAPYTGEGSFTVTAGTYTYTVTDANGCTTTTSITITEPTAISTSVVSVNVGCNGDSTGSIDLTVTGGTAPYTFDWNSGTYTTEDLTGLAAGTYVGVLADANGCTDGGTIVISEPAVLVASVTTTVDPDSCGALNGSIDITVSGGTIGYTYLWNTSATTEDLTGVGAGAYSCVVTDTNGCTANVSGILNDPAAPIVTLVLASDTICVDDGTFMLSGESPAGGMFSGTGVSAGSFDPAVAGVGMHIVTYNYTDSITGCSATTTDSIYVDVCTDAQSQVSGLVSHFSIYPNPNDGTFTIQTTSVADVMIYDVQGKLVYAQKVQPNVQTEMSVVESGMYMVTVIDANGARTSQRVMVTK